MKKFLLSGFFIAGAVCLLFVFSGQSFAADSLLIANKDVSAASLSKSEVKQIFLGKKTAWDDGKKINLITQKSASHDAFLQENLAMTSKKYKTYWKKMVFTGKGNAPKSVDTDQDVLAYVSSNSGAVGYISSGTSADNVNVITVTD